jgi:hypothetical protein
LTPEDERFISSIRTGEHGYRRGVDDLDHTFRNGIFIPLNEKI